MSENVYCTTHGLHRWYNGTINPSHCNFPDLSKPPWDTAKVGEDWIAVYERAGES